jgi:hypothetical protein
VIFVMVRVVSRVLRRIGINVPELPSERRRANASTSGQGAGS